MNNDNQLRALIVDDDAISSGTFSRLLWRQKYGVFVVHTLAEALEVLAQRQMSLIVYDLKNPFAGGLVALEKLVIAAGGSRILVLSVFDDPALRQQIERLENTEVLIKPLRMQNVLAAIRPPHRSRIRKKQNAFPNTGKSRPR